MACPPDLFCEDFDAHPEDASPGAPWSLHIGHGSAVVEAGKAVSGEHARTYFSSTGFGSAKLRTKSCPPL